MDERSRHAASAPAYLSPPRRCLLLVLALVAAASASAAAGGGGGPSLDGCLLPPARGAVLLAAVTHDEEEDGRTEDAGRAVRGDQPPVATYRLASGVSAGGCGPDTENAPTPAQLEDGYQRQALNTRLGIPLVYGVDSVHGHGNRSARPCSRTNRPRGDPRPAAGRADRAGDRHRDAGHRPPVDLRPLPVRGREPTGAGPTGPPGPGLVPRARPPHPPRPPRPRAAKPPTPPPPPNTPAAGATQNTAAPAATTTPPGPPPADAAPPRSNIPPLPPPGRPPPVSVVPSSSSPASTAAGVGAPPLMSAPPAVITTAVLTRLGSAAIVLSSSAGRPTSHRRHHPPDPPRGHPGHPISSRPPAYHNTATTLLAEVAAGRVTQDRVDDAVRRILTKKIELGLFDRPFTDRTHLSEVGSAAHRALARRAAAKSQVLLKNKGKVLPLPGNERIYVAGGNADDIGNQAAGWTVAWQGLPGDIIPRNTILEGIRQVAPDARVTFSEDASAPTAGNDVGIVVVGEHPSAEGFGDVGGPQWQDNGVPREPKTMRLNDADRAAVDRVCGSIDCVVVVVPGRPMVLTDQLAKMDALVALPAPRRPGEAAPAFFSATPLPPAGPPPPGAPPPTRGDLRAPPHPPLSPQLGTAHQGLTRGGQPPGPAAGRKPRGRPQERGGGGPWSRRRRPPPPAAPRRRPRRRAAAAGPRRRRGAAARRRRRRGRRRGRRAGRGRAAAGRPPPPPPTATSPAASCSSPRARARGRAPPPPAGAGPGGLAEPRRRAGGRAAATRARPDPPHRPGRGPERWHRGRRRGAGGGAAPRPGRSRPPPAPDHQRALHRRPAQPRPPPMPTQPRPAEAPAARGEGGRATRCPHDRGNDPATLDESFAALAGLAG